MAMYRTKLTTVEARLVDFDHPDLITEVAAWCGGKVLGRKLMFDLDGLGHLAYPGWYVLKTADGEFRPCDSGLFTALFADSGEERKPRGRRQAGVSDG